MSSKPITFQKPYDKRLREYRLIFSRYSQTMIPPSEIDTCWAIYLEFNLKPNGWNALWYILRGYCNRLQVEFPQVVEVVVNDIDFQSQTADVTIIPSDDIDTNIPSRVKNAPLKDLYVTEHQQNPDINAIATAEFLDQLRLFYHHLWRPWDEDLENEDYDWVENHLEERLKLYYYKLEGDVHYVSGKIIKHLIETGQEIYEKITSLSETLSTSCDSNPYRSTDILNKIYHLYDELERIKHDLQPWEFSEFRALENEKIRSKFDKPGILLVTNGLLENLETILLKSMESFPHDIYVKKITDSFAESLLYYNCNDTVLLGPGNYELNTREFFDYNVTIKGWLEQKPLISDSRSHWCMLESLANEVNLTNLSFDLNWCLSVMNVKRGTVRLNSVTMENFKNGISTAIHLYKNAKLVADRCHFSGFDIAIFCSAGSKVKLTNCIFENNTVCLKVIKGAEIFMDDCNLGISDNPVQYEDA